jgi:SAM-dependent methyltransferase
MHLGLIPDGKLERDSLDAGHIPAPFFEAHYGFALARAVMVATKLGVFESLSAAAGSSADVAARCGTEPTATQKLLIALTGSGYLDCVGGRYMLTAKARTWLVRDSSRSVAEALMFAFCEWELMCHVEDYVRTGIPIDLHERMDGDQWSLYQRSMRALAAQSAVEAAPLIPVPTGATDMIDVGGAHGFYSVALCRRRPGLRAVVLDLPEAIRVSAPLLAAEEMGDRVIHLGGDALTHDFGLEAHDLVLLSSLAHHFTRAENAELIGRLGRSLRPEGVLAVIEPVRSETADPADQFAALNELYFGATSRSGTWTAREIADWQRAAGLHAAADPIMLNGGEVVLQIATKPG